MTKHMTGTGDEWLAARRKLLQAEKELTRRSDELARRRQELPWVRIDKEYRFETDEGSASLTDLCRGRSQLLVCHFMFGPDNGGVSVLLIERGRIRRLRRPPGVTVFAQVPTRVDYSLAEAGEHVMPIIDALGDGCEGKQQLSRGDAVRQPVLFMSRWALSS